MVSWPETKDVEEVATRARFAPGGDAGSDVSSAAVTVIATVKMARADEMQFMLWLRFVFISLVGLNCV
jgi:hypothetical protein